MRAHQLLQLSPFAPRSGRPSAQRKATIDFAFQPRSLREDTMRSIFIPACVGLLLTAVPARAEFHPEARRAYEEHWRAHPEHAEQMIRQWHQRLFHHDMGRPCCALGQGTGCRLAAPGPGPYPGQRQFYVTCGSTPRVTSPHVYRDRGPAPNSGRISILAAAALSHRSSRGRPGNGEPLSPRLGSGRHCAAAV